jgi:Trm5-related predicted tRNA methylase
MSNNYGYNFNQAIQKVGSKDSELNKIKREFEKRYTEFLVKYQVVGDKNFKTDFNVYPERIYSES